MRKSHHPAQRAIASTLLVSMLGLATFGTPALAQQAPVYTPPAASPASAYTPPTADQLYQMTAPIALFPDQLVALVLAGSTYPDQISAANDLVTQNPDLTGQALVSAADQQPWDPSVKALTGFPAVLSQMASNMEWTTALGQAYYNDPSDGPNAVQVMRRRAQAAGHLSSNRQMVVTTAPPVVTPQYVPAPDAPLIYDGPPVIEPPPETIVIEPAQPNVVYVPVYNPAVVYGAPIAYYPGYVYEPPVFAPGVGITVGLITFGVGVAVGAALFSHVGWGWHNWGMHWAPPPSFGPRGPNGGWRPSVVYNHTTYISRTSTTIINRYNTHRVVNNYGNHRPTPQQIRLQQVNERRLHAQQMPMQRRPGPAPAMHPGAAPVAHPGAAPAAHPNGPMTMPHFNANDARPGARPAPQATPGRSMETNHPGAHGSPTPANRTFNSAPRTQPVPNTRGSEQFQHGPAGAPAHAPTMQPRPAEQPHPTQRQNAPRPQATPQPQFHPQPQPHPQPQYHPQPRPQPQYHPQPRPQPQQQFHPQSQPQSPPRAAPAPHPAPATRQDDHERKQQ
ncbi:MAG: DUF3300 domain-containing protein [Bordetella sp.]|uniref:DUF3300 domain-containing protein n=1 Tax=Bordetella sp. TaxID=28081 RepID=UPI003F7BDA5C